MSNVGAAAKHSTGLSSLMIKDSVTRAEIIWALNSITTHGSLRGSAAASDLFPLMFPDSDIASRFRMQKDKIAHVITYGWGPFFEEQLSAIVKKCSYGTSVYRLTKA
jgi:hypothetical protein